MGLGRFLWRSTSIGRTVDTVKNMVEEKSVAKGIKRTFREDFCEDNPITSAVYETGKYDGKKEGYEVASNEYETKLLEQADLFLSQIKDFESEKDAYEKLLDEYEKAINELEGRVDRTEYENQILQELLSKERKLKKIAC